MRVWPPLAVELMPVFGEMVIEAVVRAEGPQRTGQHNIYIRPVAVSMLDKIRALRIVMDQCILPIRLKGRETKMSCVTPI